MFSQFIKNGILILNIESLPGTNTIFSIFLILNILNYEYSKNILVFQICKRKEGLYHLLLFVEGGPLLLISIVGKFNAILIILSTCGDPFNESTSIFSSSLIFSLSFQINRQSFVLFPNQLL